MVEWLRPLKLARAFRSLTAVGGGGAVDTFVFKVMFAWIVCLLYHVHEFSTQ